MALYDLPPKQRIETYQVLLDIAEGLKNLNDDPEVLSKTIKEAYALTDQEQRKLDLARNEISKYEVLVKEQKQNLADLLSEANKLDVKKAELDDITSKIDALRDSLSQKERAINSAQLQLTADQKSLAGDRDRFESEKQKLAQDTLLLNQREKDISEFETSLKNKAEQLKALAGGF